MFWGFVLEPKKRYNTTVTKPFHISMAALDPKTANDNDINSLVLNVDGTETILCNLNKQNYLQQRLDLNFIEGNTITLEVKGKATVHLSGYFIYEQDGMEDDDSDLDEEDSDLENEDEENDPNTTAKALKALKKSMNKKNKGKFNATEEEEDSDDSDDIDDDSMDVSDLTFDDDDDEDDDDEEDDDEDDDDSEEEEVKMGSPGSTPMPPAKKLKQSANNTPVSSKKQKQQEAAKESGKKNKGQQQQSPQAPLTNGSTPGSNKKKNKNKDANATASPNSTPNKAQGGEKTPKKSLEGGVIVEDIKVGPGVPAKPGKMVSVYYVGKLKNNNKQFDSTTQGPGFKFRLGKGEVIKGWDVGLNGMKVGGKRRITIPAHMAYGNKGSPPAIPPNSSLVFDVELKNVN